LFVFKKISKLFIAQGGHIDNCTNMKLM